MYKKQPYLQTYACLVSYLEVIRLGTNWQKTIPILCLKKKQHIFPSFYSRHSSGSKQCSHQQFSLSLPATGWKSSSREGVLLLCQGRVQVWHCSGCCMPCVNNLPPLLSGQGWVSLSQQLARRARTALQLKRIFLPGREQGRSYINTQWESAVA